LALRAAHPKLAVALIELAGRGTYLRDEDATKRRGSGRINIHSNRSSDVHQSARSFAASRLTLAIGLTLAAGTAFAQGSPGEDVFNSSLQSARATAARV
jgi:hypothetical protein